MSIFRKFFRLPMAQKTPERLREERIARALRRERERRRLRLIADNVLNTTEQA